MPPAVLHVAQPTDYGVGRYVAALAEDQHHRGWRVAVASPLTGDLPERCSAAGIRHFTWSARRMPGPSLGREVLQLRRTVASFNPDLVHLHSSKAGVAGRLLASRPPVLFQPHAWSFLALPRAAQRPAVAWERFAARRCATVVCGSDDERGTGVRHGIRARWRVVPNAVDTTRFRPAGASARRDARVELGLPVDAPLTVCVGRLSTQKGQDVLLAAWPTVTAALRGAQLVLVGEGPDRDRLAASVVDGVHLVGARNDIAAWLTAADVVVQPSRYETLSLSMLEAMACGRSVVATAHHGATEALDANPGAVVPMEDPAALAQAILTRLRDVSLAEAEGRANRQTAEQRYGHVAWADAMAAVALESAGGS